MRNLFVICFVILSTTVFAQSVTDFSKIQLESEADYKAANVYVLEASRFVLSTPYENDNLQRLNATRFVLQWMAGTADFTFSLDATIMDKVVKGNDDLLGLYMICMTKYCLENIDSSKDEKSVKLNAVKLILAYCENPDNNIKMPKPLKKLSEANKKGELEKELQ
jgi:hypothetical protein